MTISIYNTSWIWLILILKILILKTGLDSWTALNEASIWNFVIITTERKEILYSLQDFSTQSHTGEFLTTQIEHIINKIGSQKFAGIVSDNGPNITLARNTIQEKYKNILSIRCIAHCFNLISKDIINLSFARKLVLEANTIVTYFKRSHQANALLKEQIKELNIIGGDLKTYTITRWTTIYECISSITRLKICLEKVI